jgi:ubiquitin C-terminal hydrolase
MENLECLGCRNNLKLWIIARKAYAPLEYDTYESAVVCAKTDEYARRIHPNGRGEYIEDVDESGTWTTYDNVKATLIGIAASNIERGVILSSFHAG